MSNSASNLKEQNARVEYLARLYVLAGRDDPRHPLHGTYTGLYMDRVAVLVALDRMNVKRYTKGRI